MRFIIVLTLIIGLASCSNKRYAGVAKIKNYYPVESSNPPEYRFYSKKNETTLFFKIPVIKAQFNTTTNEIDQRLQVAVYTDFTKKNLIDSLGFNVVAKVNSADKKQMIDGSVKLGGLLPEVRPLVLEVSSNNPKSKIPAKILYLDSLDHERSNYLVTTNKGNVIIGNFVSSEENHYLQSDKFDGSALIKETFSISEGLPRPPFSSYVPAPNDQEPISLDTLRSENGRYVFTCPLNSFVLISSVNNPSINTTIFHFDDNYPDVVNVEVLVDALRYITTEEEYEYIRNSDDAKAAIDEFWLSCSGSKERARRLIRSYYGRVSFSNKYFTSHVPGWKSDRGLIYVIFGPPKSVFISGNREIWDYGDQGSINNVSFEFIKTKNPYSGFDFRLLRNEIYKPNWYRVVSAWREGRIFYD